MFDDSNVTLARGTVVWAVAVILLSAALSGCRTGRGAGPGLDFERNVERVPLSDRTLTALRVRPDRFQEATELLRGQYESLSGDSVPEMSEQANPFDRSVAAMLDSTPAWAREGGVEFEFEHLARGRRAYVALTDRRNRELFRRLEVGYPYRSVEPLRRGVAVRLYLPSDEPQALADEIRDHCKGSSDDWKGGSCGAVARVGEDERYAVVDLLYRAPDGAVEAYGEQLESDPSASGRYLERKTPAAKAFAARPAALAAYAESRDFWKLQTLRRRVLGLIERSREVEKQGRPRHLAAMVAAMSEPARFVNGESREFDDTALLFRLSDEEEGGATAAVVQTYTGRGKSVVEELSSEAKLPEIDVEQPHLEFEWALHPDGAVERAVAPPVIRNNRQGPTLGPNRVGDGRLQSMLEFVSTLLESPIGVAAGAARRDWSPSRYAPGSPIVRALGVRAVRGALRVHPVRQRELGFTVRGGIAVTFEPGSHLATVLESIASALDETGVLLRSETESTDDRKTWRVAIGESTEIFGPPSEVSSEPSGRVEVAEIAERLERARKREEGPSKNEWISEISEDVPSLQVTRDRSEAAHRVQLEFGDGRPIEGDLAPFDGDLRKGGGRAACVRRAAGLSSTIVEPFEAQSPVSNRPHVIEYRRYLPRLVEAVEGCEGPGERLDEMLSAHRAGYVRALDRSGYWDRARDVAERLCGGGREARSDSGPCADQSARVKRARQLELLEFGPGSGVGFTPRGKSLVVTRSGVYAGPEKLEGWSSLHDGESEQNGDRIERVINERLSAMLIDIGYDDVNTRFGAFDPTVRAETVRRTLAHTFELNWKDPGEDWVFRAMIAPLAPVSPETMYGDPTVEGLALAPTSVRLPGDAEERLTIRLGPEGWTILGPDGPFGAIEGCPSSGPTVCLDAEGIDVERRLQKFDEADTVKAAREHAAALADAYPYRALHRTFRRAFRAVEENKSKLAPASGSESGGWAPDSTGDVRTLTLEVAPNVPFGVVARTAATTARWGKARYESEAALFDDRQRYDRLVDLVILEAVEEQ